MTREIFAVVMVVVGIFACTSMLTLVRFGCRHIDVVEGHLSSCKITRDYRKVFIASGLAGIAFRIGMAAMLLMIPKLFLYRGVADSEQIKKFPIVLKYKLLLRAYIFAFFGSLLIVMAVFSKFLEL